MIKNRRANQKNFAQSVHSNVNRSMFPRLHNHKTTFNSGLLIPILIDEILPSDTYKLDMNFVVRSTTPIFAPMDNIQFDFYFFFVPNRLVWDNYEGYYGGSEPTRWTSTAPERRIPVVNYLAPTGGTDVLSRTIGDYYGVPLVPNNTSNDYSFLINALPFRGYGLIWNTWFRDQNFFPEIVIEKGDTVETMEKTYLPRYSPLRVAKKHDYFTSCLPAPQKGSSVLVPLSLGNIPVRALSDNIPASLADTGVMFRSVSGSAEGLPINGVQTIKTRDGRTISSGSTELDPATSFVKPVNLWATPSLEQSATISTFRTAWQIQKMLERDARGGGRYIETLKAHFGLTVEDYRLQNPEFLGHFSKVMNVTQVPQTSSSDGTSPQGNISSFSLTGSGGGVFTKTFSEHGFLHGFVVARNIKTYQDGLERFWWSRDRYDTYFPALAHITEQPVYNKEIFLSGLVSPERNDEVFGYNEAWSHYRYKPNRVSAGFRDRAPNNLKEWQYADSYFNSRPTLGQQFIIDNTRENMDKTLTVPSQGLPSGNVDQFWADILFDMKCARPMPVHSVPGYVDHF